MNGVAGPNTVVGARVAGHMGIGLVGCATVWDLAPVFVVGKASKITACAGMRRQLASMAWAIIVRIRSLLRNASRSASLEMSTNSIGHLAEERFDVASSDCVCPDTKRMCPVGKERQKEIPYTKGM